MHSLRLVAVSKRLRLCNKLLFDTSAAPLFAYTCWLSLVAALLRFSFIAYQRRLTHCRPASSTDRFWSKNNMASPTSDGDSQNPTSLLLRSATKTNNTSPGSDTAYNFTTLHDSTMMASTTPNFTIIDPNVTSSNKCASCAGRATHRCQGCANGFGLRKWRRSIRKSLEVLLLRKRMPTHPPGLHPQSRLQSVSRPQTALQNRVAPPLDLLREHESSVVR